MPSILPEILRKKETILIAVAEVEPSQDPSIKYEALMMYQEMASIP